MELERSEEATRLMSGLLFIFIFLKRSCHASNISCFAFFFLNEPRHNSTVFMEPKKLDTKGQSTLEIYKRTINDKY